MTPSLWGLLCSWSCVGLKDSLPKRLTASLLLLRISASHFQTQSQESKAPGDTGSWMEVWGAQHTLLSDSPALCVALDLLLLHQ